MRAAAIPVVDLGAGDAVDRLATAYETVGFAQVVGHGVAPELIDEVFEASARFHALPREEKLTIELDRNHHLVGHPRAHDRAVRPLLFSQQQDDLAELTLEDVAGVAGSRPHRKLDLR